ncbi:MAG TPA: hypothetical protein VN541_00920 [Tepidisphaeraceae bacterium]|nr:hypothetical protein [Tepidisphaeraceae bacterium]
MALILAMTGVAVALPQPSTRPSPPLTVKETMELVHITSYRMTLVPLDELCYADDPAARAYIDACSEMARAARRLAVAARERFGKNAPADLPPLDLNLAKTAREGTDELQQMDDPYMKILPACKVEEKGDAAVVRLPGGTIAAHARKTNGVWKINFPEVSGGVEHTGTIPNVPEPQSTLKAYRGLAKIDLDLERELLAGKFKTTDEFAAERQRRQHQLMQEIAPEPAAPASQP